MNFETARRVLAIEAKTLESLRDSLGDSFQKTVDAILACSGRVVVTGMGKSGLIGHKISATLASTGTPAFFLHPADALHGDLGMVKQEDVVLALSNSGETEEILRLVPQLKRIGAFIVGVTGSAQSSLAGLSDLHITVIVEREGCPLELAPMASTTAQLALGDALCAELMEHRNFRKEDFALFHPGGKLGKRFMRVSELMHAGDELPLVPPSAPMRDVIYEISSKKLGMTVVGGGGSVAGVITDGDVRRLLEKHGGSLMEMTAGDCCTPSPVTIQPDALAAEALNLLESRKITAVLVTSADKRILGVLHLHDLWRLQLI
ncbi:MAG: KpsF/GutQ family sugar-phosphate isomerase [Acidobacteriota bacterium]|jgi:arabinose-5-phosphate isomerase